MGLKQRAISLGIFFMLLMSATCGASHLFINEFHYDNVGADANEQVEIAGTAGMVLQNWQLIFYNGQNGETYYSQNLIGIISDQANGYGSLSFDIPSIQNGPADAIALIDDQKISLNSSAMKEACSPLTVRQRECTVQILTGSKPMRLAQTPASNGKAQERRAPTFIGKLIRPAQITSTNNSILNY